MFITAFGFLVFVSLRDVENASVESSAVRLVVSKDSSNGFGSGVIFDENETHYFILTNNHVVSEALTISVVDYMNNEYIGILLPGSNLQRFDLAILKIEKQIDLKVLAFSETLLIGDDIKSLSYPSSIFKITTGDIKDIDVINHSINFPVIIHSSLITSGSSGSALLNVSNEIIGINFATYINDEGIFIEGYAIPTVEIFRFLIAVGYIY